MALNSDYFPKIYKGMIAFNNQVNAKITAIKDKVDQLIEQESRKYIVNHDPIIELPFEEEYKYIRDKVDGIRCGDKLDQNRRLELYTHIFLSGYLPSGSTIHFDDNDTPGYSELYINGVPYTSDYTCRAADGSWEKINVLVVQTEADSLNNIRGSLRVKYNDIPLSNIKIVLYDDVATQVHPIIDDFLRQDIDTLVCYGDYRWTFAEPSTLRVWKGNKGLIQMGQRMLGNLQEFIWPNISSMPNTNYNSDYKTNIRKIDISNCRGTVAYLRGARVSDDLVLKCTAIGEYAFANAAIKNVDTGPYCDIINQYAFTNSRIQTVVIGESVTDVRNQAFSETKFLDTVIFKNANPVCLPSWGEKNVFQNSTVSTIHFALIGAMYANTFIGCTELANLTFIPKSISTNLYFGASPVLTEASCLNIINSIADGAKISVSLHSTVKTCMVNDWYCKLENGVYVSCTSDDEGAMLQTAALIARGGTLA